MSTARKLKKALGIKKGDKVAPLQQIIRETESDVRPGAWRTELIPAPPESKINKHRHVPALLDDQIVEEVADGKLAAEIQRAYGLRDGYVRTVLLRKFGTIEGMKRAVQAQCLENAIALNDYGISRIERIAPDRALIAAKVMIDGALAIEKSRVDSPSTVDFGALHALGESISRIEKVISGTDRTLQTNLTTQQSVHVSRHMLDHTKEF